MRCVKCHHPPIKQSPLRSLPFSPFLLPKWSQASSVSKVWSEILWRSLQTLVVGIRISCWLGLTVLICKHARKPNGNKLCDIPNSLSSLVQHLPGHHPLVLFDECVSLPLVIFNCNGFQLTIVWPIGSVCVSVLKVLHTPLILNAHTHAGISIHTVKSPRDVCSWAFLLCEEFFHCTLMKYYVVNSYFVTVDHGNTSSTYLKG